MHMLGGGELNWVRKKKYPEKILLFFLWRGMYNGGVDKRETERERERERAIESSRKMARVLSIELCCCCVVQCVCAFSPFGYF